MTTCLVLIFVGCPARNKFWVKLLEVFTVCGSLRRSYGKRFIPAPSSHYGCCTLIRCSVTLEPRIHRCVVRHKVVVIRILMYHHFLDYGSCHFVARWLDILFRVDSTSTPSIPSTETTFEKNCWRYWRQASRYFLFFVLSTS